MQHRSHKRFAHWQFSSFMYIKKENLKREYWNFGLWGRFASTFRPTTVQSCACLVGLVRALAWTGVCVSGLSAVWSVVIDDVVCVADRRCGRQCHHADVPTHRWQKTPWRHPHRSSLCGRSLPRPTPRPTSLYTTSKKEYKILATDNILSIPSLQNTRQITQPW